MNQQRTKNMVVTLDYTMKVEFMPLDWENQALRFLCIKASTEIMSLPRAVLKLQTQTVM